MAAGALEESGQRVLIRYEGWGLDSQVTAEVAKFRQEGVAAALRELR